LSYLTGNHRDYKHDPFNVVEGNYGIYSENRVEI